MFKALGRLSGWTLIERKGHAVHVSRDGLDHKLQAQFSVCRYATSVDTAVPPPNSWHPHVPGGYQVGL